MAISGLKDWVFIKTDFLQSQHLLSFCLCDMPSLDDTSCWAPCVLEEHITEERGDGEHVSSTMPTWTTVCGP